jgi:hypothetical protein
MAEDSGKGAKRGPAKGPRGEAAERERRRREAELLRANLLKRKAQSRGRGARGGPDGEPGGGPAGG